MQVSVEMVISVHRLIRPQDEKEKFVQKEIAWKLSSKMRTQVSTLITTFPKAGSEQEPGICMINWEGR